MHCLDQIRGKRGLAGVFNSTPKNALRSSLPDAVERSAARKVELEDILVSA